MMKKIMTKVSICAAAVIMCIGITARSGNSGGGKEAGDVFTKTYTTLYDETEELVDTVPVAPVATCQGRIHHFFLIFPVSHALNRGE